MARRSSGDMEGKVPKYKQLSLTDKVDILHRLEAGEKNRQISKDYGVSHSAVSYIKKNKEHIYAQSNILKEQHGNEQRTRSTSVEVSSLEQAVYRWFCQKRCLGEPISGPLLKEKALLYNAKLGGPSNFQASNGWIHRFKLRHGIREISLKGEKLSGDVSASSTFTTQFNDLINKGNYDLDNVYNADETGLSWKSLPRRTLAAKNEREAAGRKVLKDRVTVLVCANITGTHKIPLLVIGKSKRPRCFKNINMKSLAVNYRGQPSAWIDRNIVTDWYSTIFLPLIKQRKPGENEKFLLLLDNAPSHPSAQNLNSIDACCEVIFLPPNVTALIQPMDQEVIEAVKRHYKKALLRQLLLQEDSDNSENLGDNVPTFLKTWTILDCCESIAQAWELLSQSTLQNAWKNLLPRDNTNVVPVNAHIDDEITYLMNRVPGYQDFSAEEAQAWLMEDASAPTWRILEDEELLNLSNPTEDSINSKFDEVQQSDDNTADDATQEAPAPREALQGLTTFLQWYRTRWESQPSDFSTIHKLRQVVEDVILQP